MEWATLVVVGGFILCRAFRRRWDVGIWTALGWPRIETGGGHVSAVMNVRVP